MTERDRQDNIITTVPRACWLNTEIIYLKFKKQNKLESLESLYTTHLELRIDNFKMNHILSRKIFQYFPFEDGTLHMQDP